MVVCFVTALIKSVNMICPYLQKMTAVHILQYGRLVTWLRDSTERP